MHSVLHTRARIHAPSIGVSVTATRLTGPMPAALKSSTSVFETSNTPGATRWIMSVTVGSATPSAPVPLSGHATMTPNCTPIAAGNNSSTAVTLSPADCSEAASWPLSTESYSDALKLVTDAKLLPEANNVYASVAAVDSRRRRVSGEFALTTCSETAPAAAPEACISDACKLDARVPTEPTSLWRPTAKDST